MFGKGFPLLNSVGGFYPRGNLFPSNVLKFYAVSVSSWEGGVEYISGLRSSIHLLVLKVALIR